MRHVIKSSLAFSSNHSVTVGPPSSPNSAPSNSANSPDASAPPATDDANAAAHSLRELLPDASFPSQSDVRFTDVNESVDSISPGELVIFRSGGHDPAAVAATAMACGAAGILTDQLLPCALPQCVVSDIDYAAAIVHSAVLERPDRRLLTVGIIGAAGKTTTALQIANLLRESNIRTAYQTDLGDSDGIVQSTPRKNSPAGADLVCWLGEACDSQCQSAIIEISDAEMRRGHYDAVQFDVLIVTGGATRSDDFGPSAVSCALERIMPTGVVLTPADDTCSLRAVRDSGVRYLTYGVRKSADVTAKIIEQAGGMTTLMVSYDDLTTVMETPICGPAMAQNHVAAALFGILIDKPLPEVVETLGRLRAIPGRGQQLDEFGHAPVTIDAAGSPDRAGEALRAARSTRTGGRQWCVITIDDETSPTDLARYGELAERFADQVVVTCRRELKPNFLRTSHYILDGVKNCASMRLVADHETAVRWAVAEATDADQILLIGGISGSSAFAQRSTIKDIESWVTSERAAADERNGRTERNARGKSFGVVS